MNLSILYRGPLSSCNYGCDYCPFAKKTESAAEHARDAAALGRFVSWVRERPETDTLGILFTPWGEALPHKRYQQAIISLSILPQVKKVAIQTNLSCGLSWLKQCDRDKVALWCTYHPGETSRKAFVAQCERLKELGIRFSVGIVGLKEHMDEITAMRAALPPDVYLWVNAFKRVDNYYAAEELLELETIDPLFPFNNQYHASLGKACRAGDSVISIDGDGTAFRCHFIQTPIGNIYEPNFEAALTRRPCSASKCGCHIGYVHLDELNLYEVFGDGVLERIPSNFTPSDL